jgi:diguanylate cyclase (GGDEF)-like protein/PAS domain S-box-containing protein
LGTACVLFAARPASALDPAVPVWRNVQDVWGVDDGLPQGSVNALAQTPDGYLWVGTYDGLARFDGNRFEVFRPGTTPGLKSAAIRAMLADRRGRLWIGTGGGGVSVREPDGGIRQLAGTEGWLVRALAEAPDGTIWIGTSANGLSRSTPSGTVTGVARGALASVTALLADPDGALLIGTDGHGLWRLGAEGGQLPVRGRVPVRVDTGGTDLVVSLLRDRRGDLWVGTAGSGLLHEVIRSTPGRFERVSAVDLGSSTVSALAEDRSGSLWIATGSGGLVRRRDARFERHSTATGLPHDVLSALLEDREGALWVGTASAGLVRLQGGSFSTLGAADGLPDETVYSVAQGPAGAIWVATVGGTLAYADGSRFSTIALSALHVVPAIPERTPLRSLAFSPSGHPGDLWVGTYGAGVLQRSGGVWRRHSEAQGLPNDNVRSVMVDAAGTVWAATIRGLGRYRDGAWTTFDRRQGLPSASFISLARGARGAVWFGMDGGGLGRLDADGTFHFLDHRDGLPSDVVLSLRLGGDGETLWIGTNGGLARLQKGKLASWTSRDGLPSDNVAQLAEDRRGHLWVGTSSGVARIALADLRPGSPLRARVFSHGDGIANSQSTAPSNGPLVAADGRLWFPTLGGLAVVDPSRLSVDEAPPIVHVERISADGVTLPPAGALRIPRGTGRLEIQYTGICTRAGQLVRFRHRLVGFDRDWVDAGSRRTAYYTAVPPGDYRFEVVAENADGRRGTGALDFAIPKRLWEMTWFQLGAALLLALAVLAAVRGRIRALQNRQRELEALVAHRTSELRGQNETLVAVVDAAETLFGADSWEPVIEGVLERLGNALGADRVAVMESRERADGVWVSSFRAGWHRAGVAPLETSSMHDESFVEIGFGRWLELLRKGEPVVGRLEDLPAAEARILARQHVASLAVVPVFAGGAFWGFIGIDDCTRSRVWSSTEVLSMRIAGETLGAAIADKQRGAEVRASVERYHRLFDDSLGLICTHTLTGELLSINQAAARAIGAPAATLIGRRIDALLTEDAKSLFATYLATIAERGEAAGEMRIQTPDGERVWQYSNRLVADGDEAPYVVGHAIDVTERRRLEELMRERALTDSLTGVANRAMFDDRLAQAVARAARQERTTGSVEPLALVVLDLDDFKRTNDTLGHLVGDALLREVATRLSRGIRRSDTVARLGGDEFAVILTSVGSRQRAEGVLAKLLAVLEPPLVLDGQPDVPIGVSLGMALYPEHGRSVEELMAQADAAMYAAKRAGKNQARLAAAAPHTAG